MFPSTQRFSALLAAVAVMALAVPASSAGDLYKDLRNPDSKASAIDAQRYRGYHDLRNPDSRDAAIQAELESQRGAPESPPPLASGESASGFDWGDAGIGAGSALGLVLIGVSVMFGLIHRRNGTATT